MIEAKSNKKMFGDTCERYLGEQIAVLAARYQYRGVLAEVGQDHIVLANATAVEISGPSASERPQVEDPIGGSAIISIAAIEIVYQPNWSKASLPTA